MALVQLSIWEFGIATSFLLLLLSTFLRKKFSSREKTLKGETLNILPSPPKLPIIGHLHLLGTSPHLSLTRLSEKFGPFFHLQLGHIPSFVISSARLAKEVMTTHDVNFSSRPQLYAAKHLFYNCTDMAFSPYGAYWRHIRKICILELLSAKKVQSDSFIREEAVAQLVQRVAESYPGTTNLTKILGLYANDVLCRAAFGRYFSSGGEFEKHDFQKLLEEYQVLLGGFSVGDYFPSMEWLNVVTGAKSRLVKTFRRFDDFFDTVTRIWLMFCFDLQKGGSLEMALTMDNIKAVILKAQTEIRTIMGERKTVLERDLSEIYYLKAALKEILRLHPPSPLIPRESMDEVKIDGYTIPAKGRVYVNAWAIGKDPNLWENPESFEPERFMGSTIDFRGIDFELIPFGAGRRSCPAIIFGAASMELALAQLLHSFDYELPPGVDAKDFNKTDVFGVTMHREEKLIVIAKPHFK
ncbi:hypothetical protein ACHQM5_008290 [Ranunculus cassubicifolius]